MPETPSNWHEATRERIDLLDAALALIKEHYMLYGQWPTKDWLAQHVGLKA